jgi:hypothetical protein
MTAPHTPISESQLAEWEALAEKATPGDWIADLHHTKDWAARSHAMIYSRGKSVAFLLGAVVLGAEGCDEIEGRATAKLIAASRQAVPALIAEVRALRRTAKAFLDRVIELEPAVNGAIQMAAMHGCTWREHDNYCKERDELRAALPTEK